MGKLSFNNSQSIFIQISSLVAIVMMMVLMPLQTLKAEIPAAENLQSLLEPIETWQAEFKQQVMNAKGEPMQALEGHLALKKPLKFDWTTFAPYPQVVISNSDVIWIYDEDLEQVIIRPLEKDLIPLPAAILSGQQLDKLTAFFDVTYIDKDEYGMSSDIDQLFQLKPKDQNQNGDFETLRIGFANGQLKQLSLFDALGQVTHLVFTKQDTNPELEEEQFEFNMPPGTDVIDERKLSKK